MRHLEPQLAYSDNQIAALTHGDERVCRPQSVPNIGPVTAVTFGAALDERMTDESAARREFTRST